MSNTDLEATRKPRREGGGRRGGGTGRQPVPQLPRRKLQRFFPPMEIVSKDELESIHHASLRVLSEIGMDFTLPEARDMLKAAGARVEGERVRFDPAMIEELIASAPPEFTFHARNPENSQRIGGNAITFGTVASPPNSADMDGGRRTGNYQDYRNFLKLDTPMLRGILEMSSRNQIVCVTPFTLAGAMAPVTVAGALVEQNAEALAGIAFTQLVRKGAPVIYGGFTSNVDMKSGAPAFGTPEYMKATIVGGQLARRYKVPFRTSNTCAANTVDAQAAYESVFSLWGLTMGGGNLIMHGAGWLEGGLVASFEKFILDCDLIQMVSEFMQPLETTEDALGVEAIREVGPGGHFFGAQHTLQRYTNAFYSPIISDWRNNQQWLAAGKPEAHQKANAVWKQALADYQEPAIDEAVREELNAFVDKRKAEGGAPTDF